jgi:hypothetical protein
LLSNGSTCTAYSEEIKNQSVIDVIRAEHDAQKLAAMKEFESFKFRAGQRESEATVAASKANAQIAELAAEVGGCTSGVFY